MSGSCRICGSAAVHTVGAVEYLTDLRLPVIDCDACGCRFTPHDASVHDRFHQGRTLSYYAEYSELAARCESLFAAGNADGLKRELERWPKYRFIIEQVSRAPRHARILEIGSSRGYLAAYFILTGRPIRGIDASATAVQAARAAFGDHFSTPEAPDAYAGGPFEIIYHVGLIGCVADPIAMTRSLLARLTPGGTLLFNAPNLDALRLRGQLWMHSAPPPDLVTLFPPGFWRRQLSAVAEVDETIERLNANDSLAQAARELVRVPWQSPAPKPMSARALVWQQPAGGLRDVVARVLTRAARSTGLAGLVTRRPAEFGLFVSMRARS